MMMLHQKYPEASTRATEIVRERMEAGSTPLGAYTTAEALLEAEGLVKESGRKFDLKEIPHLLNWGRP